MRRPGAARGWRFAGLFCCTDYPVRADFIGAEIAASGNVDAHVSSVVAFVLRTKEQRHAVRSQTWTSTLRKATAVAAIHEFAALAEARSPGRTFYEWI